MNNSSNPGCYAQPLCDCKGPVNREHVVSDSLLKEIWRGENGGPVYGLTFLKDKSQEEPANLGIKSLTAKILCTGHNLYLSPFDTEITKLFLARERQVIAENNGSPCAENCYVDGDRIERWMLKTLCNGIYSGNFPVPFVNSFKGQSLDIDTLKIIFKDSPFPPGWGVYVNSNGHYVNADNILQLKVEGSPEGIIGLHMWMLGCLFTLVLTDDREQFKELTTAIYRPKKIVANKTRNATVFSWRGKHSHRPVEFAFTDPPP
jgi:hypothetical protein